MDDKIDQLTDHLISYLESNIQDLRGDKASREIAIARLEGLLQGLKMVQERWDSQEQFNISRIAGKLLSKTT